MKYKDPKPKIAVLWLEKYAKNRNSRNSKTRIMHCLTIKKSVLVKIA